MVIWRPCGLPSRALLALAGRMGGQRTGYFAVLSQWIANEPMPFDLEGRLPQMVDLICRGLIVAS